MEYSNTYTIQPKTYKMSESECEEKVEHKWISMGHVLTSNPPQYPEMCSVCGKKRIGHPQESMRYTY